MKRFAMVAITALCAWNTAYGDTHYTRNSDWTGRMQVSTGVTTSGEMNDYRRTLYIAETDGALAGSNHGENGNEWAILRAYCGVYISHTSGATKLRLRDARRIHKYDDDLHINIFLSEAVTTTTNLRKSRPIHRAEDGTALSIGLFRVRIDSGKARWMGFSVTFSEGGLMNIMVPSRVAENPKFSEPNHSWYEQVRNKTLTHEDWKAKTNALHGTDDTLIQRDQRWPTLQSVEILTLEHLRQASSLLIEVGIRPESKQEELRYNEGSRRVKVYRFSLAGSTKTLNWAQEGCRKARDDYFEEYYGVQPVQHSIEAVMGE